MANSVRRLTASAVGLLGALVLAPNTLAIGISTLSDSQAAAADVGLTQGRPRVLLNEARDICLKGPVWKCHGQLRGGTKVSIVKRKGGFEILMSIKYVRLLDLPSYRNRPTIYVDLISGETAVKRAMMFQLWNDCSYGLGIDKFYTHKIKDRNHTLMKSITSVSVGNTPGEWGKC